MQINMTALTAMIGASRLSHHSSTSCTDHNVSAVANLSAHGLTNGTVTAMQHLLAHHNSSSNATRHHKQKHHSSLAFKALTHVIIAETRKHKHKHDQQPQVKRSMPYPVRANHGGQTVNETQGDCNGAVCSVSVQSS